MQEAKEGELSNYNLQAQWYGMEPTRNSNAWTRSRETSLIEMGPYIYSEPQEKFAK